MALGKIWLIIASVFAGLVLLKASYHEVDPLAGRWVVNKAFDAGKPIPQTYFCRIFLKIEPSRDVSLAEYWTCGARIQTLGEGKAIVKGSKMLLYKENWATHERDPYPNAELRLLPGNRIGFTIYIEGEPIELEFTRESNAETALDLIGWD